MRKSLLATTAIVATSMLGVAAAEASDPPSVTIRGYSRFEIMAVDQDYTSGRAHSLNFEVDDSEIVFDANTTADNGLKYGFKVEWDTDANAIDENRLRFSGPWGILDLGADDGAEDSMRYGGQNLLTGIGGYDGGYGAGFNTLGAANTGPGLGEGGGDSSDANKITYYTPRISGIQAGVSFTPDTGQFYAVGISANDTQDLRNHVGAGINYVEKFGDVDFRIHATGGWGAVDNDLSDTIEDASGYTVGGGLGWQGWSVALGYGDGGDGLQTKASGADNGDWISSSIRYQTGPYTIAGGYLKRGQDLGTQDMDLDVFTLGANWNFQPGLRLYGEVLWADIKNPTSTLTDGSAPGTTVIQNDGVVFAVGTNIAF